MKYHKQKKTQESISHIFIDIKFLLNISFSASSNDYTYNKNTAWKQSEKTDFPVIKNGMSKIYLSKAKPLL